LVLGKTNIIGVSSDFQIEQVSQLAFEVWTQHYTPIIGSEQVAYMLDKFQSVAAIKSQLADGFLYFILEAELHIGYLAVKVENTSLFISKIYLLEQYRNRGYGKQMTSFAKDVAITHHCNELRLTVNKYNTDTIKAYEKLGFVKKRDVVFDIGNDYIMDDYEMIKSL
jgi:ribosomal protein S18 acetylase RimI-like enzyme